MIHKFSVMLLYTEDCVAFRETKTRPRIFQCRVHCRWLGFLCYFCFPGVTCITLPVYIWRGTRHRVYRGVPSLGISVIIRTKIHNSLKEQRLTELSYCLCHTFIAFSFSYRTQQRNNILRKVQTAFAMTRTQTRPCSIVLLTVR